MTNNGPFSLGGRRVPSRREGVGEACHQIMCRRCHVQPTFQLPSLPGGKLAIPDRHLQKEIFG